jgi:hypothetical protein
MSEQRLIIWCGDSWVRGSGLDQKEKKLARFSTVVSQQTDSKCINLSTPGSSIGHLKYKIGQILKIKRKFNNFKILVLFGLTVPSRLCVCLESGKLIPVSVNSFDKVGYVNWAHNIFNNQHIINETCMSLSWISDRCQQFDIDFKFFNVLCNFKDFEQSKFSQYLDQSHWLVDPYWSTYGELFDLNKFDFSKMGLIEKTTHGQKVVKDLFIKNNLHPNSAGHKKIANRLTQSITNTI